MQLSSKAQPLVQLGQANLGQEVIISRIFSLLVDQLVCESMPKGARYVWAIFTVVQVRSLQAFSDQNSSHTRPLKAFPDQNFSHQRPLKAFPDQNLQSRKQGTESVLRPEMVKRLAEKVQSGVTYANLVLLIMITVMFMHAFIFICFFPIAVRLHCSSSYKWHG